MDDSATLTMLTSSSGMKPAVSVTGEGLPASWLRGGDGGSAHVATVEPRRPVGAAPIATFVHPAMMPGMPLSSPMSIELTFTG